MNRDAIDKAYANARRHLDGLNAEIAADTRPCRECRHNRFGLFGTGRYCSNPLVMTGQYDRQTGKLAWTKKWCREARCMGGGCTPDGILFERAHAAVLLWRRIPDGVRFFIFVVSFLASFTALLAASACTPIVPHSETLRGDA